MEKPKQKINAKKFLEDFRAGKSEAELMQGYGLTRVTLEKLYSVLIEKKLLERSELRPARIDTLPQDAGPPRISQSMQPPEEADPWAGISEKALHYNTTECPQCGATVGKRALTCPECGHILSGEERWESVEPRQRLVDRIPPKVLGCIIAFPIAVAFFFLFKDIILPMSESAVSKRADAIRQETKGAAPIQVAKDMAAIASSGIIKSEVERLAGEEILTRANENFTVFVAGARWSDLGHDMKEEQLKGIRTALRKSGMAPNFELVSESGQPLALVRGTRIQVYDRPEDAPPQMIPDPTVTPPSAAQPPGDPGAIEREVEKRLPAGLDRKFPNRGF
jgi:hypothetical protein